MSIKSINPATGTLLKSFPSLSDDEIDRALTTSHSAQIHWKNVSVPERSEFLRRTADILLADRNMLGQLMTTEMGKPLTQAIAEVEKCALACKFYADEGPKYLADEPIYPRWKWNNTLSAAWDYSGCNALEFPTLASVSLSSA
ncbi:aldehyde dehydrogenase family protein [Microbulbifer echini]|uniref:Aldehyde dehydrogenase family protein n=1 Tax=Microbulbifer echini TaxID=1529067 RepID=A0ABV4NP89_9GAMM